MAKLTIEAEPFFDGIERAPRYAVLRDGEYVGCITYWSGRRLPYEASGRELCAHLQIRDWRTMADAEAALV